MTEAKRHWKVVGPPAVAGSTRVEYFCDETGERCYRAASWGEHGTRVHAFRAYGAGYADYDLTQKIADAEEFR